MYRIKIQEKNNGQKTYTPQVGKLVKVGNWIKKRQEIVWHTIVYAHGNTFGISKTVTVTYRTEESALQVIEDYKNKDVIEEGNKVKSTTYKMIDDVENKETKELLTRQEKIDFIIETETKIMGAIFKGHKASEDDEFQKDRLLMNKYRKELGFI
jgi:hypothetical protein